MVIMGIIGITLMVIGVMIGIIAFLKDMRDLYLMTLIAALIFFVGCTLGLIAITPPIESTEKIIIICDYCECKVYKVGGGS